MREIKLGDLCTVKSHPFRESFTNILIAADANDTPPVMVICELYKSSGQHNPEDGTKDPDQICGIYFSHKSQRFEKHRFKKEEIKLLKEGSGGEPFETEKLSLNEIRNNFRNRLAILRNVEVELEKEKVAEERRGFENHIFKRTAHLDFVPPVMTIIDVRAYEKIKDNFHKTTGQKKRVHSEFEFKCRYYNPATVSFSEEWLPEDCMIDITENFKVDDFMSKVGTCVFFPFKEAVALEESKRFQIGSIVKIRNVVFQHYKYVVLAEDLLSGEILKIPLAETCKFNTVAVDELFESKVLPSGNSFRLPDNYFESGKLYEISYVSEQGVRSTRTIMVSETEKYGSNSKSDVLITSNCFLRKGKVRHFKLSNVKSARKLKDAKKADFII
jgi:hypothetical protein